jgi:hypothetical protein
MLIAAVMEDLTHISGRDEGNYGICLRHVVLSEHY